MAINFTDFSRAPLLDSPWVNMFENVLKGYQMSKEPEKMNQESSARELANKLKGLELEHKPKEYELNDKQQSLVNSMKQKALDTYDERWQVDKKYKQAQIQKANQPASIKGALGAAFQLRDNLNPNDPNYERDRTAINNYIQKLGTQAGQVVLGEGSQPIKINLPEGKEGYVPGVGKLKNGWQNVTDAQGNTIGVNVPMTEKQIEQWKAKEKFDVIYPFLNDSLSQYSGQNSWEDFSRDAKNYTTDEAARSRIDNFLAAKKLLSIGTTTENARIGGHATNVQLKELKNTLDASEVNKRIEQGKGLILPSKYAKNSGNIFKGYLDKVEDTAKTNIPAYEFRALNPGTNNQSSGSPNPPHTAQNAPEILGTKNGISTIRLGNDTYEIPENLVDKFMQENSPQQFGGQYE